VGVLKPMAEHQIVITLSDTGMFNVSHNGIKNNLIRIGMLQMALYRETEDTMHPQEPKKIIPFPGTIPPPPPSLGKK